MGEVSAADTRDPIRESHLASVSLALINDNLDLSKVEAGRMELQLSSFSLPDVLHSALSLVRERAGQQRIALGVDIDPALGVIEADDWKVKQIVLNLLSNAVKFTPSGGRVELRARRVDGAAEISVRDAGVGIPAEEIDRIFEEFRQARSTAAAYEGTGLGLALTRGFAELHGGMTSVESVVGAGSIFRLRLPLEQAPRSPAEAVPAT